MKVKELIELLRTLDQEREIWVLYDMNYPQEPNFEEATEAVEGDNERTIKVGDYVHDSW